MPLEHLTVSATFLILLTHKSLIWWNYYLCLSSAPILRVSSKWSTDWLAVSWFYVAFEPSDRTPKLSCLISAECLLVELALEPDRCRASCPILLTRLSRPCPRSAASPLCRAAWASWRSRCTRPLLSGWGTPSSAQWASQGPRQRLYIA